MSWLYFLFILQITWKKKVWVFILNEKLSGWVGDPKLLNGSVYIDFFQSVLLLLIRPPCSGAIRWGWFERKLFFPIQSCSVTVRFSVDWINRHPLLRVFVLFVVGGAVIRLQTPQDATCGRTPPSADECKPPRSLVCSYPRVSIWMFARQHSERAACVGTRRQEMPPLSFYRLACAFSFPSLPFLLLPLRSVSLFAGPPTSFLLSRLPSPSLSPLLSLTVLPVSPLTPPTLMLLYLSLSCHLLLSVLLSSSVPPPQLCVCVCHWFSVVVIWVDLKLASSQPCPRLLSVSLAIVCVAGEERGC